MLRALTAVMLLLIVGACNRAPAANSSANSAVQNQSAIAAPAPPTNAAENEAGEAEEEADVAAEREPAAEPAAAEEERAEGCAGEIGLPAARRLVEQCTEVSPATRPPCNVSNSCAMVRDEIERGCGFLEEEAPAFCK